MLYRFNNIALLILLFSIQLFSADDKFIKIEDLNDFWRFNIGDNNKWANPKYNDSDWDVVLVPSRWEDEGYNGYDGFAWYRKQFEVSPEFLDQRLYLSLGVVDDVAEIYINGNLVGVSGSFPPTYETAYSTKIWLPLPEKILNKNGANIIAVRVYDESGEGGIYTGDVGIFMSELPLKLLANFEGRWKFKTGDNIKWKENKFDDKNWKELNVPSGWDHQGYKDYDGFAWYRLAFNINLDRNEFNDDLIVMVGKIDDIDETFMNGKLIGSTGDLIMMPILSTFNSATNVEYNQFRGYRINKSDLRNGENVIAIRVYDGFQYGGIYEGPIGIVSLKDYLRFRTGSLDSKKKTFLEKLFK